MLFFLSSFHLSCHALVSSQKYSIDLNGKSFPAVDSILMFLSVVGHQVESRPEAH